LPDWPTKKEKPVAEVICDIFALKPYLLCWSKDTTQVFWRKTKRKLGRLL